MLRITGMTGQAVEKEQAGQWTSKAPTLTKRHAANTQASLHFQGEGHDHVAHDLRVCEECQLFISIRKFLSALMTYL